MFEYQVHTSEGSTSLHERWRFVDDETVEQKLWTEAYDGPRTLIFEGLGRQRVEPR